MTAYTKLKEVNRMCESLQKAERTRGVRAYRKLQVTESTYTVDVLELATVYVQQVVGG